MRRSLLRHSRVGEQPGREERSPRDSLAWYLVAHFLAVAGETWNRSAARRMGQCSSMIKEAKRRLPSGVSGALAGDMKTSVHDGECGNPHPAGGLLHSLVFTTSRGTTARTFASSSNASRKWLARTAGGVHELLRLPPPVVPRSRSRPHTGTRSFTISPCSPFAVALRKLLMQPEHLCVRHGKGAGPCAGAAAYHFEWLQDSECWKFRRSNVVHHE